MVGLGFLVGLSMDPSRSYQLLAGDLEQPRAFEPRPKDPSRLAGYVLVLKRMVPDKNVQEPKTKMLVARTGESDAF